MNIRTDIIPYHGPGDDTAESLRNLQRAYRQCGKSLSLEQLLKRGVELMTENAKNPDGFIRMCAEETVFSFDDPDATMTETPRAYVWRSKNGVLIASKAAISRLKYILPPQDPCTPPTNPQ